MTATLYVLDVVDFVPLAEVASRNPDVTVAKRGPYYEVSSEHGFEIERNATGCRNAIWFSSVAAVRHGRVARWDRDFLRVEPVSGPVVHPDSVETGASTDG
jgi:hypothetical protein